MYTGRNVVLITFCAATEVIFRRNALAYLIADRFAIGVAPWKLLTWSWAMLRTHTWDFQHFHYIIFQQEQINNLVFIHTDYIWNENKKKMTCMV